MKKAKKALRISDRWNDQPILKVNNKTKSSKDRVWKTQPKR